ncbi:MAG TPA: Uma2 family endonuclease [Thermoanaerobaculia bacterium]|nr:Uma2 family endonuclease [Thermoanaerobaculia bacterium]
MATPARKLKYTYQDYLLFPDDGSRHEIIGGEHYVTPAPNWRHQLVAGNFHRLVSPFVYENRLGYILFAPLDLVLSDEDVVQPDLLFISRDRASIAQERGAFGAPDLVIEILSESTRRRDETIKLRLYEEMGVREYWLADHVLQTDPGLPRHADREARAGGGAVGRGRGSSGNAPVARAGPRADPDLRVVTSAAFSFRYTEALKGGSNRGDAAALP